MSQPGVRLAGVELYFDDLPRALHFYATTLGLAIANEPAHRYAQFNLPGGFLCLEGKGLENYPSADKAVVFLEVGDLPATLARVRPVDLVKQDGGASPPWAAIRDPEGHTLLLLQAPLGPPAEIPK